MDQGICVEVGPCGDKKLLFKAFLVDIKEKEVIVRFLNKPQHKVSVDCVLVRFPPAASETPVIFKEDDIVEVYDSDPTQCCWNTGIVQKMKEDFIVVSFGEKEEEIVTCENVRAPNNGPSITNEDILKFYVAVPEKYSRLAEMPDAHSMFLTTIKAGDCVYLPDSGKLQVITLNKESERLANVLIGMHLEHLEQRVNLQYMINEANRLKEKLENQIARDEFEIEERVIGRAVGVGGHNIHRASNLPGILSVDLRENKFFITGKSKEVVAEARNILEFVSGFAFVPRYLVNRVLSQDNLETLRKGSLIVKLHFVYNDEAAYQHLPHKSGHVSVLMTGLKDDIAAANLQIEYLVNLYTDMLKIKRQLNLIAQPDDSGKEGDQVVTENGDGAEPAVATKHQDNPHKKSYDLNHKNRPSQNKREPRSNHYDWRSDTQVQVK